MFTCVGNWLGLLQLPPYTINLHLAINNSNNYIAIIDLLTPLIHPH